MATVLLSADLTPDHERLLGELAAQAGITAAQAAERLLVNTLDSALLIERMGKGWDPGA